MPFSRNRAIFALAIVVCFCAVLIGSVASPWSFTAASAYQPTSVYPQIENFTVYLSQGESTTINVPVDNLGSSRNWTSLHLSSLDTMNDIKITTDPFLFEEGFIQADSDNYSLSLGIEVSSNVTPGSYLIPLTLTARSSITPPLVSTLLTFNLMVVISKSEPAPFPIIILYLSVIFVPSGSMIGIILVWSKKWNFSEVEK